MNEAKNTQRTIVLDTGLFKDSETLSAALLHLNLPENDWYQLTPESMNDADWDEILSLVLSANRVITV